ncbi:MAG: carbamate kinase [Longimicrobiales bacterium]|nr:carbamate kinase [Longimicrobiales bacterium]
MRVVVALGGNALLRRGEPLTPSAQRANVRQAAQALAPIASEHELVVTHGNGPQVGLLALQAVAHSETTEPTPLDVLGAETEGMIGYVIEQELGNVLPFDKPLATILTMVEVDPEDPAFDRPTKPIGPVYDEKEARRLAAERGWSIAPDGQYWRRVVASPEPRHIFEIRPIRWLLEKGSVVICAGGGGIPTMYMPDGTLAGAEVVIDKDRASALLARELEADVLVLATDVEGVYVDFGGPDQYMVEETTPQELAALDLPEGSMGSKVEAASTFVAGGGEMAVIGALHQIDALVAGTAGTRVRA